MSANLLPGVQTFALCALAFSSIVTGLRLRRLETVIGEVVGEIAEEVLDDA